jgi:DHA1 family multidrug resistance protein-like MFS transporter
MSKDRYYPRLSVMLVSAAVAFSLLGDMALYTLLPLNFSDLGLLPFQVGILLSVNRWIRLLTNHLAERMISRFSTTLLFSAALISGSAVALIYGTAPPFLLFLAVRLLWGFCWSLIRQIGVMTSINTAEEGSVGTAIGYYNGITRMGVIAGTLLGGILFDMMGFQTVFFLLAAVSLTAIPTGLGGLRMLPETVVKRTDVQDSVAGRSLAPILLQGFVTGTIGRGMLMSTLGFIIKQQAGDFITFGQIIVGIATLNGIMLASRHVINSIVSPFLGTVMDRLGYERGVMIFFSIGAFNLVLAAVMPGLIPLLLLMITFFMIDTTLNIGLAVQSGKRGSRTYASFVTATDLGGAVGPLIGWTAFEFISTTAIPFSIGAALYAGAAFFAWRVYRKGGM